MTKPIKHLIILFLMLVSPAWAANTAENDRGTVVAISATSFMHLPNDEVVVTYRIEASGGNTGLLQKQVNTIAEKAQTALARFPELKQQTTGRSLQAMNHYDKVLGRQIRDGWRMVQNEQIVSHDLQGVAEWVGVIEQAGANLEQLSFTVSEASATAAMERLHSQAIHLFRNKAATIAKSLGATSFRLLSLGSDSGALPPLVMQRGMMAMSAADAAPALNSGESRLSVTVSGEVLLPERIYPAR
ncbi:MAG: hypothetical protein COS82_03750 [Zetaproteobacteria bacterium CG06_land_8_20_14_3_00_59_53]|nr:MAG: hypothetical protein AUK36_00045 [Zetaproteobacteria bacterium CG2_30_59_37]PIO89628.1 MAG: hypothetical protein COX56_07285 [Zetaproteobacteria bacterium CG23_combo_of_CG06-09_8_20_14_all_59_86]PIQ65857.1 MAG: hypothetical protein COV97_02220 [Zetaproteobacteria bacterium CG11_big_fil_rev_8_21_14_0_20_59_439]PIU71010.1 MAG: hypothetical protein COS82_03750 [Zetaproteobacteria bacterium CG06_land_8_20_14_3_00_59_53]PIU97165.1 MAG: hypothetical protein COS62_05580 [Zetaproteobacteria bac